MSEKVDGWVAWHPEQGFNEKRVNYSTGQIFDERNLLEVFVSQMEAERTEKERASGLPESVNEGWRIRPVKLVFLDEDKEGEE